MNDETPKCCPRFHAEVREEEIVLKNWLPRKIRYIAIVDREQKNRDKEEIFTFICSRRLFAHFKSKAERICIILNEPEPEYTDEEIKRIFGD